MSRVRRLQHDLALAAPLVEQLQDAVVRRGVDAGHRLVEQDHVGLLRQRARDERAPLLAAGQLADLPLREVRDAEMLHRVQRDVLVLAR